MRAAHKNTVTFRFSVAFLSLAVALLWLGEGQPFRSSEVGYTDVSESGLLIVPASCPSEPDYSGQCTPVRGPDCAIMTNPTVIIAGQSATMQWLAPDDGSPGGFTYQNTSISNYGAVSPDGSATISPTVTTRYTYTGQMHYAGWWPGVWSSFDCDVLIIVDPSPCPTALGQSADGKGYRLAAGISNQNITRHGLYFCTSNSSGTNYFVPANILQELQSFRNAVPRLPGVTVQDI